MSKAAEQTKNLQAPILMKMKILGDPGVYTLKKVFKRVYTPGSPKIFIYNNSLNTLNVPKKMETFYSRI